VTPSAPRKRAELHAADDFIESTPLQTAMVSGFGALALGVGLEVGFGIAGSGGDPADIALRSFGALTAMVGGWAFADLGTSVYHWGVDNYGSPDTPLFGFRKLHAFARRLGQLLDGSILLHTCFIR
jgi:Lipid desaturase domain